MSKSVLNVWTFSSDSNPNKSYETLQYEDMSTSCGCPGWTRRVDHQGNRTCKHTRLVDQGLANSHCQSSHSYTSQEAPAIKAPKGKAATFQPAPVRKILW